MSGVSKNEFRAMLWVLGGGLGTVLAGCLVTRFLLEPDGLSPTVKTVIGIGMVVIGWAAIGLSIWRASVAAGKDFES